MFERERRRGAGVVEANETELRRFSFQTSTNEPDGRKRVGRRAQPDIPNHKFTGRRLHAFRQVQLPDVKCFGLDGRPNDGMKRLVFGQRTDRTRAVAQIDKRVAVWHGRFFPNLSRSADCPQSAASGLVGKSCELRQLALRFSAENSSNDPTRILQYRQQTKSKTGNPRVRIAGENIAPFRVAPSPCPSRRKAGPSWLRFHRPCSRSGTWCP